LFQRGENGVNGKKAQRIGIMASDPLRALGLLSILEEAGMQAFLLPSQEEEFTHRDEVVTMTALVLDARTTNNSSIEALTSTIARLRKERAGLKVVVMDVPLSPEHVQSVIAAGAKGYLAETATENEIRMALEVVLDGSIWAPRKVLARLIEQGGASGANAQGSESVAGKMSRREAQVLELLLRGQSNRDIAEALKIDEVTVKAHLGRMLRKTGSTNRVELTLKALEERGTA
jgi:DNA-binding NarL/FixJ family response regulator